jgi:hypothetical protein
MSSAKDDDEETEGKKKHAEKESIFTQSFYSIIFNNIDIFTDNLFSVTDFLL